MLSISLKSCARTSCKWNVCRCSKTIFCKSARSPTSTEYWLLNLLSVRVLNQKKGVAKPDRQCLSYRFWPPYSSYYRFRRFQPSNKPFLKIPCCFCSPYDSEYQRPSQQSDRRGAECERLWLKSFSG